MGLAIWQQNGQPTVGPVARQQPEQQREPARRAGRRFSRLCGHGRHGKTELGERGDGVNAGSFRKLGSAIRAVSLDSGYPATAQFLARMWRMVLSLADVL